MGSLRFLVDENVLYQAHDGLNEKGQEDLSAGALIFAIVRKCHKFALDDELLTRYRVILKTLESKGHRGQLAVNVSKILSQVLMKPDKVFEPTSRVVKLPEGVPDDDLPLVELAIDAKAIFVTTDDRLAVRLGNLSVLTKHGLEILRPEVAVGRASAD